MPTPKKGPRLGGSPKHHNMMVANLATELFRHGRIKTTKSKAKTMQPVAERMITFARRGDLHARRQVLTVIRDKDVVHKLFAHIGPAAADRNGGYTRITAIGPRKGDNAPMAVIELVDIIADDDSEGALTEAPRRRWSLRRRRNNMSRATREREESILAAEDAGEEDYEVYDDEDEAVDAVPVGSISERELGKSGTVKSQEPDDEDGPEVTPEDVEARLASEDDEDEASEDEATEGEASEDQTGTDEEE